ncbi:Counting factor associated protein D, partial [Fragariocoptes setiger]
MPPLLSVAAFVVILTANITIISALKEAPEFATNYRVEGTLSLPYAELSEPFTAFYDKNRQLSRIDYYDNLYNVYQFGPKSGRHQYGVLYKMAYAPMKANALNDVKKHCFMVQGGVGSTIDAQTVLPNLADFQYGSTGPCPRKNFQFHGAQCELWRHVYETKMGKKNTYKMWVQRLKDNTVVPVYYYMQGYDTLLGSHYDRYDVIYNNFARDAATDKDFILKDKLLGCGPMPGPGFNDNDHDDNINRTTTSEAEHRLSLIVSNPIHEYISGPHDYEHVDHEYDKFAKAHERKVPKPGDSEHKKKVHHQRWFNFLHNMRFIRAKNRSNQHYQLKVNRFADHSSDELRYLRGRRYSKRYNGGLSYSQIHGKEAVQSAIEKFPKTFDWRIAGAVTPVKDQAVCGSCWSFGTTGTIEGAYFVKTGQLLRLSQQQLVDCSWPFANNGCDGGEDFRAYEYIEAAGGLATEEEYGHYLGVDGKCHQNSVKKAVKVLGFYNVTSNDVAELKHALLKYGPVTVAIDASPQSFTFYSHGIFYEPSCKNTPDGLDHQVLLVGFGVLNGQEYWLIKNSWSTYWGNDGYINMAIKDNNCGVMTAPTVPIVETA